MLVAFAFVALGLSHATMVSVMAMTPVHLMQSGATIQIVGIVISLHIAGMFLFSPLFGIMADRLGRVPTVLGGPAGARRGGGHHRVRAPTWAGR